KLVSDQMKEKQNHKKELHRINYTPKTNGQAHFRSVLSLNNDREETIYAERNCKGSITTVLTGEEGFGYDPLFIPKGYTKTMAQLGSEEKNKISHRYYALKRLEKTLQEKGWIGETDA